MGVCHDGNFYVYGGKTSEKLKKKDEDVLY